MEAAEFSYIEPYVTEIVKQGQDNDRAESHLDEVPKTSDEKRAPLQPNKFDQRSAGSAAPSPRTSGRASPANSASKKSNNKAGRPKNK